MVNILIKTDSHYTVNRGRIRNTIENILKDKKVKTGVELSISIIGDRMMRQLNKKFREIDDTTDVLSFPLLDERSKVPFVDPPDEMLRLGDIVISYPQVIEEAVEENKLIDDKIDELIVHGLLHLFGNHHE